MSATNPLSHPRAGGEARPGAAPAGAAAPPAPELPPLRSVHTTGFGGILQELGISLLVSTYQAGKPVVLRPNERGGINTHFRNFARPVGLAAAGDRLAIGTAVEVWEFHNVPAVARQLDPPGSHDACLPPRSGHVAGAFSPLQFARRSSCAPESRPDSAWQRCHSVPLVCLARWHHG